MLTRNPENPILVPYLLTIIAVTLPVAGAAGLFTVNAIVDNPASLLPATGAATLALPQEMRTTILIPVQAVRRQGDLTGVQLLRDDAVITRWVRLGVELGDSVEVVSGLRNGDRILVPAPVPHSANVQAAPAPVAGR